MVKGGVERLRYLCAFERLQEVAAEQESHQLSGGKTQGGNIAEAFHQTPPALAVAPLGDERKTGGLKRFEIAPQRARIFRIILRDVLDHLVQRQAI